MAARIALTQRVEDLPDRGERRDALDQAWTRLVESVGAIPVLVPNSLGDPAGFLAESGASMVVLTGGNDLTDLPDAANAAPERDRTERALLDTASGSGMPVLGVCRGLQLMVHHAGGSLTPSQGHRATRHPVSVSHGHGWPLADGREVNSFHDWAIPPDGVVGLDVAATAPDGTVEAVCHRELPQVGIMWHPEREPEHPADGELIRALLGRAP